MTRNDDKTIEDVEASPAPPHVTYPTIPLAFHSSPHFGAVETAAPPIVEAVAKTEVPSDEPWGLLDLEEPVETYGVDELAVLARDPWTLFCWWEATDESLHAARTDLGGEGALVLRLVVTGPGAPPQTLDVDLGWSWGRRYLGAPRSGATVMAALGVRAPDGRFAVLARAPRCAVPPGSPSEGPVEWMEVAPTRSSGAEKEPPAVVQAGSAEDVRGASTVAGLPFEKVASGFPGALPTPSSQTVTSPTRRGER